MRLEAIVGQLALAAEGEGAANGAHEVGLGTTLFFAGILVLMILALAFEEKLHADRRAEGELPIPRINELWMEANRPMLGDAVHLTDDYSWWWLYIPHFVHSPFYCYAYAFGELLVLALLRRYDEEGEAFIPRYLDLLRAGGSESPRTLLARMDLDIGDPDFWKGGLAILGDLVGEAEQLASQ